MSTQSVEEEEPKDITVKILRTQFKQITKIVESSQLFRNETDFISDAIRDKILGWHQ